MRREEFIMANKMYINVCIFCGKAGGSKQVRSTPPTITPAPISGTCPASPDKKHKPRWTEV